MSAGYSGTPLPRKLGIVEGATFALVDEAAGAAALLDPLPDAHCPMDPGLRASYTERDPAVRAAVGELLAHRDFVYREHLGLPLDF